MGEKNNLLSKKKLITVLGIALGVVVLLCVTLAILPLLSEEEAPDNSFDNNFKIDYNFYPADYNEDIFTDEEYLRLIEYGILEYDDGAMITEVNDENADGYGKPVELIVDMLYAAINGDADEYNSYFSKKYFKTNEAKDKFTMQKIYDGRITFFACEDISENGKQYTEYTFKLKYRIFKNNGTFRDDIGDGYRLQHVTISDREGEFKIDAINAVRYK